MPKFAKCILTIVAVSLLLSPYALAGNTLLLRVDSGVIVSLPEDTEMMHSGNLVMGEVGEGKLVIRHQAHFRLSSFPHWQNVNDV